MATISHDITAQSRRTFVRRRAPTISLIATVPSDAIAGGWLLELSSRCTQIGAELIVVTAPGPSAEVTGGDREAMRVVFAEATSSQLELRARGVQAAEGDVVLFVRYPQLIDATTVATLVGAGLGRGGVHPRQMLDVQRMSSMRGSSTASSVSESLRSEYREEAREPTL